jgi:hypothetical protein
MSVFKCRRFSPVKEGKEGGKEKEEREREEEGRKEGRKKEIEISGLS